MLNDGQEPLKNQHKTGSMNKKKGVTKEEEMKNRSYHKEASR